MPAIEAIEHLVGLQAQAPRAPYVGLWTRLEGFQPEELERLICERRAVPMPLMRSTIHLVSARDAMALRTVVQPALDRDLYANSIYGPGIREALVQAVVAHGTELLSERPRTLTELRGLLAARWPDHDATAMAYAVRNLVALVQVPPRGLWNHSGQATWATTESWLARPLDPGGSVAELVLRYLAAFGPASVNALQTWSGLTRLREVTERLQPRLRRFQDQNGVELLDLPDAARPDPDTPVPPRFLPECDNTLLSHADPSRIIPGGRRTARPAGSGAVLGSVLIDGFRRATWTITRERDSATLHVQPFKRLPPTDISALSAEGAQLLAFAAANRPNHDIHLAAPAGSDVGQSGGGPVRSRNPLYGRHP